MGPSTSSPSYEERRAGKMRGKVVQLDRKERGEDRREDSGRGEVSRERREEEGRRHGEKVRDGEERRDKGESSRR
jgi:hypothetical protein